MQTITRRQTVLNGFAAAIFSVMALVGMSGATVEGSTAPLYAAANKGPLHGFIALLCLRYDLFGTWNSGDTGKR
jgi:hypothetical protein